MAKDLKLGPSVFSVFIRTWAPGLDQSRGNMNPLGIGQQRSARRSETGSQGLPDVLTSGGFANAVKNSPYNIQ